VEAAFNRLVNYLNNWAALDAHLLAAIAGARRVFNLGGGLWSSVLAAYCPKYWARVECCLVDGFAGECMGKAVRPRESVELSASDVVVLGTNPYVQQGLVARFKEQRLRAISWNEMIPH
jgi:hypothetical protein